MAIISVIVPVFNSESTLSRCVDSILKQSFNDFELILVNDGSTDNSAKICEEYAKLDTRVVVINKENGGVSSARNFGIERSNGKFILFCDSDDYVEKQWIEDLYNMLSDKVSMAVCTYCGIEDNISDDAERIFYDHSNVWEIIKNKYLHVPCNKIFDATIIKKHDLKFNENYSYAEDTLFCLDYFEKLEKVGVLVNKQPMYRQCIKPNSLSRRRHIDKYWEVISKAYDKIDLLLKKYDVNKMDIKNEYSKMYLTSMITAIDNVFTDKTNLVQKNKQLKQILYAERTLFAFEFGSLDKSTSRRYYDILKSKKISMIFIYKFLSKAKIFVKHKIKK